MDNHMTSVCLSVSLSLPLQHAQVDQVSLYYTKKVFLHHENRAKKILKYFTLQT